MTKLTQRAIAFSSGRNGELWPIRGTEHQKSAEGFVAGFDFAVELIKRKEAKESYKNGKPVNFAEYLETFSTEELKR